MSEPIVVRDLGIMPYRDAWQLQEQIHDAVAAGAAETILIVQHPPVVTLGRRAESIQNLVTTAEELQRQHVELVHSDRGGDITFHGPGQLVAYPIIRLDDHALSISRYVHRLEAIVITTLTEFGIVGQTDPEAIGDGLDGQTLAKICAIGVRIRRRTTLHGLALNVTTDLAGFSHIIPCGLPTRPVTSIAKILGNSSPTLERVKNLLIVHLKAGFKK